MSENEKMRDTPQTYHIWTIGCQMNEADSRHLSSQLESLGLSAVKRVEDADLVILNTCVVRQQAEDKIHGKLAALKGLRKRRPQARIAVMGCLVGAKNTPDLLACYPYIDVLMPPSDTSPLIRMLDNELIELEEYNLPRQEQDAVSAHVPVVLGCSHVCTYCIIPYRRGPERSRPPESILREVRRLAEQGVREVVLLGQIVDRYGLDLEHGPDLAGLLRRIAEVDQILRIRFLTSHPLFFTDTLLDAVAQEPKICPHFELPNQAGDNEVLVRMRRGYTIEVYCDLVRKIRARLPDAAIHTDIIVGFPGETEDQFMATYHILEEMRFDKAHIAKYSPRPQTYAARRLPDDVPAEEKERRRKMLDNLQQAILAEKNSALLNQAVDVLVERRDKRHNRWYGRTVQDKIVYFDDPDPAQDLIGRIVAVKIEWTGPFSLIGRSLCRRLALFEDTLTRPSS